MGNTVFAGHRVTHTRRPPRPGVLGDAPGSAQPGAAEKDSPSQHDDILSHMRHQMMLRAVLTFAARLSLPRIVRIAGFGNRGSFRLRGWLVRPRRHGRVVGLLGAAMLVRISLGATGACRSIGGTTPPP